MRNIVFILALSILPLSLFPNYGLKNGENVKMAVVATSGIWGKSLEEEDLKKEIVLIEGNHYTVEDVKKSGKDPLNFIIDKIGAENILDVNFSSLMGMFFIMVIYK